ncbi:MAG: helix-turn-helix domain-containing protein [Thermoguttaceae bacterium]|jgi:excisionase family DNA binding protein|nr:helix-turn-helix domain-containing protein [Thermoguttaceae bacterium]
MTWFNTRDAARYLGISPRTLRRWVRQGVVLHANVFGRYRFRQEWLEAVFAGKAHRAGPPTPRVKEVDGRVYRDEKGKLRLRI